MNKGDNHHIEVRAYDDEGNAFSSLEGFKFEWTVVHGHDNIMRIGPKDAGHTKTHTHQNQVNVLDSDDFFLKALNSGFTGIKVTINETSYTDSIKPAFINLTIVEPFEIRPESDDYGVIPYVLPTSDFNFMLQHLKIDTTGVTFHPIKIPSANYKWSLLSQDGKIGNNGVFQSTTKAGEFEI